MLMKNNFAISLLVFAMAGTSSVVIAQSAPAEVNDWTLNSHLTYGSDRFSVSAWVKNITDKTTYPFGIAIENLFGVGYRARALPRQFGIEGTVKF
jgi:hypothetical protein